MTLHSRVLHQHKAWSRDTGGSKMVKLENDQLQGFVKSYY
jgi:hypothetical protein